jgi:WD40 repeat protein
VEFSPDGKRVATAGDDEIVQIWDISTRKKIFDFHQLAGSVLGSLSFHPLKPFLAVGCDDLRFWDWQTGQPLNLLTNAPTNGVCRVVFSPNGEWIALGMDNGQVSIWDFVTGRLLYQFHEHLAAINVLRFSHDGRWLASGGDDNRVVLYNVRRGVTSRLEGHTFHWFKMAFAPDDKTLVSTSYDGTIRFWSVANHQVALILAHDGGPVTSVAFSPDGNLMATSGSEGTVRFWPAAKLDEIPASKNARANRK